MGVLLITGGSGYLGRHLCRMAAPDHTLHTTFHTHAEGIAAGIPHRLNITDRAAVRALLTSLRPDAIIHCAASNPGQNESEMMKINCDGSKNIAASATEIGARMVHVSTDMVHDGTSAPYTADAAPHPITLYGKSKAAAEAVVQAEHPAAAIVRTSLIYGLDEMDRGTAGFVQRLKSSGTLTLFEDQIRQPVWVETLSAALLVLAVERTDIRGTLTVAGRESLSRAEFGERLLDWWRINFRGRTRRGHAADLPTPSPLDLRLEISTAESTLGMEFFGVDRVFEICQSRQS